MMASSISLDLTTSIFNSLFVRNDPNYLCGRVSRRLRRRLTLSKGFIVISSEARYLLPKSLK